MEDIIYMEEELLQEGQRGKPENFDTSPYTVYGGYVYGGMGRRSGG